MSDGVLVGYSSSSSEDESSLVQTPNYLRVSTDRRQGGDSAGTDNKEFTQTLSSEVSLLPRALPRLPIPESVLHMFQDDPEEAVHEDSARHGGRVRNFPHERGNWASYVYIPYEPVEEFLDLLDMLVSYARKYGIVMTKMEEFHITLSRTVVLRHHWIHPFVQSIRDRMVPVYRFFCVADRLKAYTNQEKNRTFLGLEVSSGHPELQDLVWEVDGVLQEFDLEVFYEETVDGFEDSALLLRLNIDEVHCKAGNKIFSVPLR
ncbi:U6 snRNA phosphodiesterase 1 isoform X2 [Ambystoma mexicanum]|uniref:U6 snRNA phosphodiesterase 1 isoform X2 n=1 Tax=Ambystoma mexicanum TaxID=8296 RepID=UPI0037E980D2